MKRKKITQEEFEYRFWMSSNDTTHWWLCEVFMRLGYYDEFKKFWHEINIKKYVYAHNYANNGQIFCGDAVAMFRLMIAQEFIEQYNEGLI